MERKGRVSIHPKCQLVSHAMRMGICMCLEEWMADCGCEAVSAQLWICSQRDEEALQRSPWLLPESLSVCAQSARVCQFPCEDVCDSVMASL